VSSLSIYESITSSRLVSFDDVLKQSWKETSAKKSAQPEGQLQVVTVTSILQDNANHEEGSTR